MNENKNVTCPATDKDVVAVNLKELLSVYADMKRMFYMLKYLIAMVQKEEKLKQHHRPYLELRREMLNMCENYLRDLAEIAARTATPLSGCPIKCVDGCGNKDRYRQKRSRAYRGAARGYLSEPLERQMGDRGRIPFGQRAKETGDRKDLCGE